MNLPEAIIVDMDGTLVDVEGARHYVLADESGHRDFEHFHQASLFCPANEKVTAWVHEQREVFGRTVFVVTARKARWERLTRDWLAKHEIPYDALCMRSEWDNRHDYQVKQDILAKIRETHEPVAAIDDNPSVIALWERAGIPEVIVVPGWVEDPHYVVAR
jgi:FMN phosphatase YigB (HAD superfamily)